MLNSELWQKPAGGGAGFYDYQIEQSCYFDGTSSYLTKTWGQAATTDDKKALSFWFKRNGTGNSAIGSTTNTKLYTSHTGDSIEQLEFNTGNPSGFSDQFGYFVGGGSNGAWYKGKLRDVSAWYHIAWIYDSTQSTANDRVKIYLNGVNLPTNDSNLWNYTNSGIDPYPSQNTDTQFGKNGFRNDIGRYTYNNASYWGGTLAEFIMIDGTAAYTDFGEFKNGVWIPKDPSGLTFGNNGFHLKFENSGDLGNDSSGNNNDWTASGLGTDHQLLDTPTTGTG